MKNIAIIGNSDFSLMLKKYIEYSEFGYVKAFVVDEKYVTESSIEGIDVFSFEQFYSEYPVDEIFLIMGTGYLKMGSVRQRLFLELKNKGYIFLNYIHPSAVIAPDVMIGEGNVILESVVVEAGVKIGNANLFFARGVVGHDSTVGSFNTFSINVITAGGVKILDNNFFGVSSFVKDSTVIGDFVLVGAGACGFNNIPSYSVVASPKSYLIQDKNSLDYY